MDVFYFKKRCYFVVVCGSLHFSRKKKNTISKVFGSWRVHHPRMFENPQHSQFFFFFGIFEHIHPQFVVDPWECMVYFSA